MKRALGPASQEWPACLNELGPYDPPRRLYAEGIPLHPSAPAMAVVGTRRPSAAGVEAAERIAGGLAEAGITIVSGMAVGIDAAAHRAALDAGGRTVAVLGCGLDVRYPARNLRLKERVAAHGTLLSEYPEGTPPQKGHFPLRNRIISGLSAGVVVVEGALTSGALVTARLALDADRSVYAVPGSIRNPMAAGPNHLIRTSQALLVTSVEDLLEDLFGSLGPLGRERALGPSGEPLAEDEAAVLAALDDVPVALDAAAGVAEVAPGRAAILLATMELRGLAVRRRGGYCITGAGARALGVNL